MSDWHSLIPDYLKDQLSAAQRQRMEAAMEQDPALAQAVAEQRAWYLAGRWHRPGGLGEQVRQTVREEGQRRSVEVPRWAYAAAAVVVLLLGVALWWSSRQSLPAELLAARPDHALVEQLLAARQSQGAGPAAPGLDTLIAGLSALQQGQPSAAVQALQAYAEQMQPSPEIRYYLALAQWQNDQPEAAGETLQQLVQAAPTYAPGRLAYAAWLWQTGQREAAQRLKAELAQSDDPAVREAAQAEW